MAKGLVLFLVCFLISACTSPGKIAPSDSRVVLSDNLILYPLAPGFWRVSQESIPYQANGLLYAVGNGMFFMVDTPVREEEAKLLLNWVKSQPDFQEMAIFNSHFHEDAAGTNHYFGKDEDVHTLSTEATYALLKQRFPENLPKGKMSLDKKGERGFIKGTAIIFHPGRSHSPDDTVVYFPESKILFGSCMVKSGKDLGNLKDADLKAWKPSLEKVKARFPDVKILVAGHDTDLTPSQLDNTLSMLK